MAHSLVSVLFLFSQLILLVAASDEVTSLPGLNFNPPFRHYSGYLEAGNGSHLFYWFYESQHKPDSDPVVLWLNGGPGCSSLFGALVENGPLQMQKNSTFTLNPYSWNKRANLIYLESPAGVGFSYREDGNYTIDDDGTATANFLALKSFFTKYPHLEGNDFYITGESYGGIYVPTLGKLAVENKYPPKFKAVAIGNGILDYDLNSNSKYHFLYHHGYIDSEKWNLFVNKCCPASPDIDNCAIDKPKTKECSAISATLRRNLPEDGYNIYNDDPYKTFHQLKSSRQLKLNLQTPFIDSGEDPLEAYFNQKSVRLALHVSSKVKDQWRIEFLLNSGKKVLVYNGDFDSVCNYLGDDWFVQRLNRKVVREYTAWRVDGHIGGFKKVFENITFTTVRAAGHMVPADQPARAFDLFDKFLSGEIFQ